jgi:outer membrane protein assembly factor BamB
MFIFNDIKINTMNLNKPGSFDLLIFILITIPYQSISQQNSWTHFRGNNLDGIALVDQAPVKWSGDSNLVWKTEIHDKGWSSPVVCNNQIWMTTAEENGKEMFAVCVDYQSGETIFDILLFKPDSVYRKHNINSYATPTPCIDEEFVYVNFGRYGTACLNTTNGKVVWQRNDIDFLDIQGPGSSLMLYKDLLILHCEGIHKQQILALSKATGETIWQIERPKDIYDKLEPIGKKAYTTPLIVNVNGKDQLISNGSAVCIAYDPDTGEEIWRVVGGIDSTISMPFSEDGIVFFYTGFKLDDEGEKYAELLAVNPEGKGDITETHIIWRMRTPILQLLTPVVKDGLIYTIDTRNIMMCIDAKSGDIIWSNRVKGKFNASPIYANGNIYFCSTNGDIIVINEGKELDIISENELEGEIWTTPVILNGNILIRTSKYLYKIGS